MTENKTEEKIKIKNFNKKKSIFDFLFSRKKNKKEKHLYYITKQQDNIWTILENSSNFWKYNNLEKISQKEKERVIYNIVEKIEKDKKLQDVFLNLTEGKQIDLLELKKYIKYKKETKIFESKKENINSQEFLKKEEKSLKDKIILKEEKKVEKQKVEKINKDFWKTVNLNENKNIKNGFYKIKKEDDIWTILNHKIFKDILNLDKYLDEKNLLDYKQLNNLTANTIEVIKILIQKDKDFADKIGVKDIENIVKNEKLNIELIREMVLKKKFGKYENLVERARLYNNN